MISRILALSMAFAPPAAGADVTVVVSDVRDLGGRIHVAACEEAQFLESDCFRTAAAAARAGEVEVLVADVPPGKWAFQSFHDADSDDELDTGLFGMPEEGMGFGNDAPMRFGPPDYADAMVTVGEEDMRIGFRMRYFDD